MSGMSFALTDLHTTNPIIDISSMETHPLLIEKSIHIAIILNFQLSKGGGMQEIRFHGRGGQGAVIGSEVLAHAFFIEGKYVQAFPSFGVERRGAPVTAFCRMDDAPINLRNQIYKPDHVVVLDASLVETAGIANGLKHSGSILINTNRHPGFYQAFMDPRFRIYTVDASAIAAHHKLGSASNPIVNTAICGAFARATGVLGIEAVEHAIDEYVPVKKANNKLAARQAFQSVIGPGNSRKAA